MRQGNPQTFSHGKVYKSHPRVSSQNDSSDAIKVSTALDVLLMFWKLLTPDALPIGDLLVTQSRHNLPLHTELDLQSVLAALLDNDWGLLQIIKVSWGEGVG